jgi:hypothetical protein
MSLPGQPGADPVRYLKASRDVAVVKAAAERAEAKPQAAAALI